MIGWLNDINRLVSKDKREPRVIPAENTHTLALYMKVNAHLAYLVHTVFWKHHHHWRHYFSRFTTEHFDEVVAPIIELIPIEGPHIWLWGCNIFK